MERITQLSNFPWVEKYEMATGEEGLVKWWKKTYQNLEKLVSSGDIDSEKSARTLFEGIRIGYPDQSPSLH